MQLTGKQIVENGIVTGDLIEKSIQQQGFDVRLARIAMLQGTGEIPAEGKTVIPKPIQYPGIIGSTIHLEPGYYEVEFIEGCKIPANVAMQFKTRSSLVRSGAIIESGQFDGGFETEHMGAFLIVHRPIRVEIGARVAQMICTETYTVEKEHLYDGQWQNDNQRTAVNP